MARLINCVDNHALKLYQNIVQLFNVNDSKNQFSDIQVNVENRTFYCHKLILQLGSDYFANLSSETSTETLQCIHPEPFYNVLQYMYTGEVFVSKDNVESLISVADILSIDDLKDICFRFLDDTLNIDLATLYWRIANKYNQSKLARKCQLKVLRNFRKLKSVSSLINVSEEMMKSILSDEKLKAKNEMEVCEIMFKWLQIQTKAGNKIHPEQLLPSIRWKAISMDFINAKLLQNTLLASDPVSNNLLSKVLRYRKFGVQFDGLRTFHRTSTGLENCLLTIGLCDGSTTSSEVCQIGLQRVNSATVMNSIPTVMNRTSVACLCDDTVYVIGTGGSTSKEMWKWNVSSDWIQCADMITDRKCHCVAVHDSMIYVIGGWTAEGDKTLSSVDCYNTKTNIWSSNGQLTHAVKMATCVTYKDHIYVFCGVNKDNVVVDFVQAYDPVKRNCILNDHSMPRALTIMRAMCWESSVILLGSETCFLYNFETQVWQERSQFKTDVDYFASVLDNTTIYIAGGGVCQENDDKIIWVCTDEVKSVSVLDIVEDRHPVWKRHAKLPKPTRLSAFVSISLPIENKRDTSCQICNYSSDCR